MVPLAGIEPALLAELDFESSASTNSAIGARTGQVRMGADYTVGGGFVNWQRKRRLRHPAIRLHGRAVALPIS